MKYRQTVYLRVILLLLCGSAHAGATDLLKEDWDEALDRAAREGKHLYVAFLGDGWSLACSRFQEGILNTSAFRDFVADQLVYCPILARRTPKLTKDEIARLQALVIHFDVKTYPSVLLIAPDGTEILRHGYRNESIAEYLKLLDAVIGP